jgi:hypothetical protein
MRVLSIVPVGVVALLLWAYPVQASAQAPVVVDGQSQTQTVPALKAGSRVWVVTPQGERAGKLESMSQTDVAMIADDGQRLVLPWKGIVRLERPDPIANGVFFGALAGFGGGFLIAAGTGYFGGGDESSDAGAGLAMAGMYAAIGAGVGAALDVAMGPRQVIYRSGQTTMALAPAFSPKGVGLRLNIRW